MFRPGPTKAALDAAQQLAVMKKLEEVCVENRIPPQVIWLPYNNRSTANVHTTLLEHAPGATAPRYQSVAAELLAAANSARVALGAAPLADDNSLVKYVMMMLEKQCGKRDVQGFEDHAARLGIPCRMVRPTRAATGGSADAGAPPPPPPASQPRRPLRGARVAAAKQRAGAQEDRIEVASPSPRTWRL